MGLFHNNDRKNAMLLMKALQQASQEKDMSKIEWVCQCCGQKFVRSAWQGSPDAGRCYRRGNNLPHAWIKNKIL